VLERCKKKTLLGWRLVELPNRGGMCFLHPRDRTSLSSEIFCPFWENEVKFCAFLLQQLVIHMQKLTAFFGIETQAPTTSVGGQSYYFFLVGFAPICALTFDFSRFACEDFSFCQRVLKDLACKGSPGMQNS